MCDVSEIITAFLLNTCRLPPCPKICDVQAAAQCAVIAGLCLRDDEEDGSIPLTLRPSVGPSVRHTGGSVKNGAS